VNGDQGYSANQDNRNYYQSDFDGGYLPVQRREIGHNHSDIFAGVDGGPSYLTFSVV
jgi:hypothetical protein